MERLDISPDIDLVLVRKIVDLRPGDAIELLSDQDPGGVLTRLQHSHGAHFNYRRLQIGPAEWRIKIVRRDPNVARSIGGFLGGDHKRLRETWAAGRYAVADCNLGEVRRHFSEFSVGLNLHIRMEEEILFPAIEERTGIHQGGPTAAMRAEHARFKEILGRLNRAIEWETCEAISRMLQSETITPEDLMNSHDLREERVLYPMADRIIPLDNRIRLILAMQAL